MAIRATLSRSNRPSANASPLLHQVFEQHRCAGKLCRSDKDETLRSWRNLVCARNSAAAHARSASDSKSSSVLSEQASLNPARSFPDPFFSLGQVAATNGLRACRRRCPHFYQTRFPKRRSPFFGQLRATRAARPSNRALCRRISSQLSMSPREYSLSCSGKTRSI